MTAELRRRPAAAAAVTGSGAAWPVEFLRSSSSDRS